MKRVIGVLAAIAIGAAIAWYAGNNNKVLNDVVAPSETLAPVVTTSNEVDAEKKEAQLIVQATYDCVQEKTVTAAFYKGEAVAVEPGQMPVPTGSVKVVLSDGRNFDLAQTISADGGRYANSDESFVFWDKGDAALILESGAEKDYTGCVNRARMAIKVISPNGGESWTKGEKVTISWSAPESVKAVNIRLSVMSEGEGQVFNVAIAQGAQNTGSYEWTVQELYAEVMGVTELPASDKYIVTVEDADGNSAHDTSDAPFSIK